MPSVSPVDMTPWVSPGDGVPPLTPDEAAVSVPSPAPPPVPAPARRRPLRARRSVWAVGGAGVLAAAVAVSVLVAPGSAGPGATEQPHGVTQPSLAPKTVPLDEVAAVLKRRTAAVVAGDKKAFLADVDVMDPGFVAKQARLFDNLQKLPLAVVSWKQNGQHSYAPPASVVGEAYVPAVVFSYRLKGFDRAPVPRPMALTFVRRGAAWFIAADDHVKSLPDQDRLEPWDVGPIAVARTAHVVIVGAPQDAKKLHAMAVQAEDAIKRVRRMWSKTGLMSVVVYVPRDSASLTAYFPSSGNKDIVVSGLELPLPDRIDRWFDSDVGAVKEAGNRVVVNTRSVKPGSRDVPVLLRHEITHVATSRWTHEGAPTWLIEGAAEYTAFRDDPYARTFPTVIFSSAAQGHLLTALPTNAAFYKQTTGYDRAYLLCYFIKVRYGESKLIALYRKTGAITKPAATVAQVRKDINEVLGVSQAQLLASFNSWARTTIRPA